MLFCASCGFAQESESQSDLMGRLEQAISARDSELVQELAGGLEAAFSELPSERWPVTVHSILGQAYAAMGRRGSSTRYLRSAAELLLESDLPAPERLQELASLADQLRALGVRNQSAVLYAEAVALAESTAEQERLVDLYTRMAEVELELDNLNAAAANYRDALNAITGDDISRRATIQTQLVKLNSRLNQGDMELELDALEELYIQLPDNGLRAELQLQLAGALVMSNAEMALASASRVEDYLEFAAENLGLNSPAQAYINGYRGRLRWLQGIDDVAVSLTREALYQAAVLEQPNQVYRWSWQLAGIEAGNGRIAQALDNYRRAIRSLGEIEAELLRGPLLTFRERVTPLYTEFLNLLVEESIAAGTESSRQRYLDEVQQVLESFNRAEVLDYFDDDCLLPVDFMALDTVASDTAIVYPLVLPGRIALLVRFDGAIQLYTVNATPQQLRLAVSNYRDMLEFVSVPEPELLEQAGLLYDWLVRPYAADLESRNIETLVYITSAALRPLPMTALHDGESYLIEKFAVVSSLGMQLTDASTEAASAETLLGGVSEGRFDFIPLDNVESELAGIAEINPAETILNQDFSLSRVTERLAVGNYSTVHMATHGYFDRDPSQSFVLAYDGRLNLDILQETIGIRRYAEQPLDLLVLSACETAAGDERAVLGLAGVSLKAGARTSLGSLWTISDEATSLLMIKFYEGLQSGLSKADAVRAAQLSLLDSDRYQHPNFWSPFVLVGNWN